MIPLPGVPDIISLFKNIEKQKCQYEEIQTNSEHLQTKVKAIEISLSDSLIYIQNSDQFLFQKLYTVLQQSEKTITKANKTNKFLLCFTAQSTNQKLKDQIKAVKSIQECLTMQNDIIQNALMKQTVKDKQNTKKIVEEYLKDDHAKKFWAELFGDYSSLSITSDQFIDKFITFQEFRNLKLKNVDMSMLRITLLDCVDIDKNDRIIPSEVNHFFEKVWNVREKRSEFIECLQVDFLKISEYLLVAQILHAVSCFKYYSIFKTEHINCQEFLNLTEEDLSKLRLVNGQSIPLGLQKKIHRQIQQYNLKKHYYQVELYNNSIEVEKKCREKINGYIDFVESGKQDSNSEYNQWREIEHRGDLFIGRYLENQGHFTGYGLKIQCREQSGDNLYHYNEWKDYVDDIRFAQGIWVFSELDERYEAIGYHTLYFQNHFPGLWEKGDKMYEYSVAKDFRKCLTKKKDGTIKMGQRRTDTNKYAWTDHGLTIYIDGLGRECFKVYNYGDEIELTMDLFDTVVL